MFKSIIGKILSIIGRDLALTEEHKVIFEGVLEMVRTPSSLSHVVLDWSHPTHCQTKQTPGAS